MQSTAVPAAADAARGTARVQLPEAEVELPIVVGSEGEHGVNIGRLRDQTGYITVDPGFGNTAACNSAITFIDGEEGILRYRGYPIEELAEKSSFVEVAMLLIFGQLPAKADVERFRGMLTDEQLLHEGMRYHFEGFPSHGHPMAMLSAMINACGCYHPELLSSEMDDERLLRATATLMSKVCTIAAFSYKMTKGQRMEYPDPSLSYCRNFLHMMFSMPHRRYEPPLQVVRALTKFLILHADHEQNCSTSTVRMVGSSGANVFASVSSGVCALWGPLHGGANMAVIEMLQQIHDGGDDPRSVVAKVKDRKFRLMGFGHRVYKNFDPRAKILEQTCSELFDTLGVSDPLLDIARELAAIALTDDYFLERRLYPNVDFYSGIILRALGIPLNMFTVMFSIGRVPGWIAHWYELYRDPDRRICRPRQIYTGSGKREYVPIASRGC
ncbi:citrate synthase [Paludisphaera mucosa]|uniref:Citrate synthase n=1 Tax=Paludisphaera mucosa TaxID=3030827 RepID=A0ABT6F6D7_9BACT|nr:citrate synthase [Paludisphaera mucosa]MDG3002950.1 citrate synthase [Paludisphaera mucosa]